MTEAFTDEVKQQLVIAGAIVAGKGATPSDVSAEVKRIAGYLNPNSEVQRAFAQLDKEAENTVKSAGFIGTIIGYGKEETSNRGLVMFRSSVSSHTPEGKEHLRTDFLEEGGPASALMRSIQGTKADPEKGIAAVSGLVGHKVRVSFDLVKKNDGSGQTVRVLRSITDSGVDPEYNIDNPDFQPAYYTDVKKQEQAQKLRFFPRVPVAA